MRDLVLIAIVSAIATAGLFRPVIGLLGYVWFALMRPDVIAHSSGAFPHSFVLAVATIVGSLRSIGGHNSTSYKSCQRSQACFAISDRLIGYRQLGGLMASTFGESVPEGIAVCKTAADYPRALPASSDPQPKFANPRERAFVGSATCSL